MSLDSAVDLRVLLCSQLITVDMHAFECAALLQLEALQKALRAALYDGDLRADNHAIGG